MFGQNQGMGKRFIVLTLSSYPFCKKTRGRWDKVLKPHYKLPQTFYMWDMDEFTTSFQSCQKIVNNMKY
jgi:hypothetical protein